MPSPTSHSAFPFRRLGWLVLVCLIWCGPCLAQDVVLHLQNGDRITGHLVSEGTNGVVMTTPFAERLSIGRNLIEKQEVFLGPPTAAVAAAIRQAPKAGGPPSKLPPPPASGVVSELVLTNKPAQAPTASTAKPASPAAKPRESFSIKKFIDEWGGEAQFGANLGFSTKDRQAVTGRIKVTHNHIFPNEQSFRNILGYDMSYGTTDGVLSDNRMEGTWKIEHDLTKRFLWYNATGAGYDEIRGVDFQYEFGPGLGYKWLVLTNFVFKTELGGDYQKQYFVDDRDEGRYSMRLAEDTWWQITPKVRWEQRLEFFPEIEEFADFRVRVESNLSYLLRQNLTLTLNVVDLYDTSVPSGVSKNDLQIRSLLGIKF